MVVELEKRAAGADEGDHPAAQDPPVDPVDVTYVRALERRLQETEQELTRMRAAARKTGLTAEAAMSGKAAYDWQKDTLELKLVIAGVSRRPGLLQELAALRVDDTSEAVAVVVSIRPLVAQEKLDFDSGGPPRTETKREPQAAAPAGDAAANDDAGEGAEGRPEAPEAVAFPAQEAVPADPPSETPADVLGDEHPPSKGNHTRTGLSSSPRTSMHVPGASADTLPVFRFVQDDYYGTGLPCYQVEANLDMAQLAEAAFQAGLSECAIQLLRTVQRGDGEVRQTVLYHYRGPGHHPVIERITSARLARWADEMRARRSA